MDYLARNKSIFSILILLTILGVCTESFGFGTIVGATEAMETQNTLNGSSSKPRNRRSSNKDVRAKRAEDAAARQNARRNSTDGRQKTSTDVAAVLSEAYVKMAETLNSNRKPTKEEIASNVAALRIRKDALVKMDKNMQAKYYMLTAWNEYFTGKLKTAQQAAVKALRTLSVEDTRVTMTSITLLVGEKAVIIPEKKPAPKNTNQGTNLLDLDLESLNTDLVNPESPEPILAMQLNCLNSTTFTYTPGSESLCVIFWQLSDKDIGSVASSEPNDPSAPSVRPAIAPTPMPQNTQPQYNGGFEDELAMQQGMNSYGSNPYGNNTAKKQNPDFLSNTKAFKDLFAVALGLDNVKFLAVNTDTLANKQKVAEKIMENAWPWAHVMAHDPKSRDTQFKEIAVTHEKPLMVITSSDGTIKYAGPAVGFLAPMMFSKVTGEEINATSTVATVTRNPGTNVQPSVASKLMGMFAQPRTGTKTVTATKKVRPTQPKEMDIADQVDAGKRLEYAKMFINVSRKITTPKNGIAACREIMQKYPNTEYSEQARMLLRKVPERYRKRYKVTDEELGL